MLLNNEVKAGEIYVYDPEINFGDESPSLWQIVEMPKEVESIGMDMKYHMEMSNPTWENIYTGELVTWGSHCFTTIERMKKQFFNINMVSKNHRSEYVKKAFKLISDYETYANSAQS